MIDAVKMEKLAEVLQNESVLEQCKGVSEDNALEILKENGVELSNEEFEEIRNSINVEEGELSENALDAVAGGITWKRYWSGLKETLRGFIDGLLGN